MRRQAKIDPNGTTNPQSRKKGNAALAVLIVLVGLGVLLYPVIATQWNNIIQQQAADAYSKLEKSVPTEVLDTAWEEAHRYNAERSQGPILDAWASRRAKDNEPYQEYLHKLHETDAMGRIIIPSIKSDLPIYHGTSEDSLQRGVGHLYGTDLPVGSVDRHSVLSAHTGLQNATLWDNLNKVKEGDAFYIAAAGHKLKYQVDRISVVLPEETDALQRVEGQDLITLVTCTPYGINTHRLLVQGHQVPMDPQEEKVFEEGSGMNMQWWMWAILAAAVLTIVLLIVWWRKNFSK